MLQERDERIDFVFLGDGGKAGVELHLQRFGRVLIALDDSLGTELRCLSDLSLDRREDGDVGAHRDRDLGHHVT